MLADRLRMRSNASIKGEPFTLTGSQISLSAFNLIKGDSRYPYIDGGVNANGYYIYPFDNRVSDRVIGIVSVNPFNVTGLSSLIVTVRNQLGVDDSVTLPITPAHYGNKHLKVMVQLVGTDFTQYRVLVGLADNPSTDQSFSGTYLNAIIHSQLTDSMFIRTIRGEV